MPDDPIKALVSAIHSGPLRMVVAVAGGGSRALSALLSVPGASRTMLEAVVPYSHTALTDWLGAVPNQTCSEATARTMAMRAYVRACSLAAGSTTGREWPCGIACTSSLATNRPKKGQQRIFVAAQRSDRTSVLGVILKKNARDRSGEEELAMRLILNTISEHSLFDSRLELGLLAEEAPEHREKLAPPAWQELMHGKTSAVLRENLSASIEEGMAVLPGSFNPIHRAHREMARIAACKTGCPVHFEISVSNVDKPPLDYLEMADRLGQFAANEPVWFTNAPAFVEKSRIFPGATFIVGADTIRRIGDAEYYQGDSAAVIAAIDELRSNKAQFLVFGRQEGDSFLQLADLNLPENLRRLCQQVSEEEFRDDISSTQIRHQSTSTTGMI